MIISRTPFRISFAGGGTDLPAFYEEDYGAVFSLTLKKYLYVNVSQRFEPTIRVSYSKTEITETVEQLEHTIVKEALRKTGLADSIEVVTISDIPAGTGMGSSSSLTVGVLKALYGHNGYLTTAEQLAEEACEIEMDILQKPIGKQDQYSAAFGGINYIKFNANGTVNVEPIVCSRSTIEDLESQIVLYYTGQKRSADQILQKQSAGTKEKLSVLKQMRDIAFEMTQALTGRVDMNQFASLLHEGWLLKKSLGFGIANPQINDLYDTAMKLGARGGKLLGAGGGGFLLIMAPKDVHSKISDVFGNPKQIPLEVEPIGSQIIFCNGKKR